MHAVNGVNPWCDCYQTMHPDRAKPGTVIKVHAGQYRIDRHYYREADQNQTQRWLHGTILLTADGTPEEPIAIVAAGDGEVVIDGADCDTLFNVQAADHLHICDNFIESDGGYCNIRILRNRCFNCMGGPLSMQPAYAGPVYWIRNVVYNASGGAYGFKVVSVDDFIAYHNTLSNNFTWCGGGADCLDIRNNVFMGPGKGPLCGYRPFSSPIGLCFKNETSNFDYNAHRVVPDFGVPFQVRRGGPIEVVETFTALAEMGIEKHGLALPDYSGVFVNAQERCFCEKAQG
jgi:hypothetical protein